MTESRIAFDKMTFVPDVPSTALLANEYNDGENVETDIRGIRSVFGDQEILSTVPGTPTFVSGGFRQGDEFWFVVATDEGYWWASNGGDWQNITPGGGPFSNYSQTLNITDSWNGTVAFFNDSLNPPMFWPDQPGAVLVAYSNQTPLSINSISNPDPGYKLITFNDQGYIPFPIGSYIVISGITAPGPTELNGTFVVVDATSSEVLYESTLTTTYDGSFGGEIAPQYTWNYISSWKTLSAGWMRMYNTPNVGSILVAGNLAATDQNDQPLNYPVTVQWSQSFGLNQAPTTWQPTVTNVANQLEVPLRGPALDAFPCNGQFFLCSYWDTVVFSPLNYTTTSAPILGVRLFTQGRGLLSTNCWALADNLVYGVDARDIWVFDGQNFTGLGNQRVKNWFYDNLDTRYIYQVFMKNNTEKNQIELFYPDKNANGGVPNKMLSYRYDLQCWNPPRDVSDATFACESPIWTETTPNLGSRTLVYARGVTDVKLVQKDQGYSFINNQPINSRFRRDNMKLLPDYSGHLMVHRILPEVVNLDAKGLPLYPSTGNLSITIEGAYSVGQAPQSSVAVTVPINTDFPWAQIDQNEFRVNTLQLSNSSTTNAWICNATTWQVTKAEDDR